MKRLTEQQVRDAHAWYMADADRSLEDAAWEAGVSPACLRTRMEALGLERKATTRPGKPQGNRANAAPASRDAPPRGRIARASVARSLRRGRI